MAERCIKGDYIGFTFCGVHSSELGLMRVSNGSRYEQDLLPPLQDKTAQVNGRDGAVYFGSQYNTKPIKVPVAFDNMTEESFNQLKRLLQDKKPKYLWFDETPYKQWLVKAANVQNFKWVCFDESHNGKEKRIYKGEGTIEFSCFSSYAESRVTFLDEPVDSIWVWNETNKVKKLVEQKTELYVEHYERKDGQVYIETFPILSSYVNYNGNLYNISKYRNILRELKSDQGYLMAIQSGFRKVYSSSIYYPEDTAIKNTVRCYCTRDRNIFPLQVPSKIEESSYFPVYEMWGDKKETTIAISGITPTISEPADLTKEYYYTTDPTLNSAITKNISMLFYEDENGHIYWINPVNGEPDYEIPIFLSFVRGNNGNGNLAENYNATEWIKSSGLRTQSDNLTAYNIYENLQTKVYNAGDKPTDLFITYSFQPTEDFTLSIASSYAPTKKIGEIKIKAFDFGYVLDENENKLYDEGFMIDSKLKLIKGLRDGKPSSIVYNKAKISGDFFKIPVCNYDEYYIITSSIDQEFSVEYKHYYI